MSSVLALLLLQQRSAYSIQHVHSVSGSDTAIQVQCAEFSLPQLEQLQGFVCAYYSMSQHLAASLYQQHALSSESVCAVRSVVGKMGIKLPRQVALTNDKTDAEKTKLMDIFLRQESQQAGQHPSAVFGD